jgi:hypothetical protein
MKKVDDYILYLSGVIKENTNDMMADEAMAEKELQNLSGQMQNLMSKITPILAKIKNKQKAMTAVGYFLKIVQNTLNLNDQTLISLIKKNMNQPSNNFHNIPKATSDMTLEKPRQAQQQTQLPKYSGPKPSDGYSLEPLG